VKRIAAGDAEVALKVNGICRSIVVKSTGTLSSPTITGVNTFCENSINGIYTGTSNGAGTYFWEVWDGSVLVQSQSGTNNNFTVSVVGGTGLGKTYTLKLGVKNNCSSLVVWNQRNIKVIASYVSPCSSSQQRLFEVYPNPAVDKVSIKPAHEEAFEVEIYNLTSEKVINERSKGNALELNISALKAGVYLLKIHSESTFETHRLVIEH
jgi:hypothetical protein